MGKSVWVGAGIVLLLSAVAGVLLIPTTTVDVNSSADLQFALDERMPRVRKILVRTNAIKKIVAMADAKLLNQEWLELHFEIDRPILNRDWNVEGDGQLIVQINEAYLGDHELTLQQAINIQPERLHVQNDLQRSTGAIKEYKSTLTLTPGEKGKAKFDCSLQLRIQTTANWLTKSTVENRIRAAATEALGNQEEAIRKVVAEHAEELFILPGSDDERSTRKEE